MYIHIHATKYINIYIYIYIYIYIHTYTYLYIYIYTYIKFAVVYCIWMNLMTHVIASCHTCARVLPRILCLISQMSMRHVTRANASCHTCRTTFPRDLRHMDESYHTFERVISPPVNESWHTFECGMSHKYMHHVKHVNESCHTCAYFMSHTNKNMSLLRIMGWLQLVGSLKLQVSFADYRLFYRALLQKRPIISRNLLLEATP